MIKKSGEFWHLRSVALGGLFLHLLVFLYVILSWLIYVYLSPHPPPRLRGSTLTDALAVYFTSAPPHFLFCIGGLLSLMSEVLVRWTKNVFLGLFLTYMQLPVITFVLLFGFSDMAHSGNMQGDLKGYWFLTNFYVTFYWIARTSLKWFIRQLNWAINDAAS